MSLEDVPQTEAGKIAELAVKAAQHAYEIGADAPGFHTVVLPQHLRVEQVDLERLLPAPRRKTGTYYPATLASFTGYVTNHADADETTIWVDQTNAAVVAVLNDNPASGTAWRDHRAILRLTHTVEWQAWIRNDGKLLTQVAFAEHIQARELEIVDPAGATMLEIAQTMEGKADVAWKSAQRLRDGEVSLVYSETVEATAVRGTTQIPSVMRLQLTPYVGADPIDIAARIRYRVREGHLTIGYQLERPGEALLEVLDGIAAGLGEKFPHVYVGQPA